MDSIHLEKNIRFLLSKQANQRPVCHGIRFYLTSETLQKITQAKQKGQSLYIPPKFLKNLRYYTFFSEYNILLGGFSFSTYYHREITMTPRIYTLISAGGDILYQIDQKCLNDPDFAENITMAHFWLMEQLLNRLTLEWRNFINQISWGFSIILGGGYTWYNIERNYDDLRNLILNFILIPIISVGFKYLLQFCFKQIITIIRRWFFQKILLGNSSDQDWLKQAFLLVLGRLGI